MKKISTILTIAFIIVGCDCPHNIEGFIQDKDSQVFLENVLIWNSSNPDSTLKSDLFGYFNFKVGSKGIISCPKVELVFKKDGYKLHKEVHRLNSKGTVIIKLEKDFNYLSLRQAIKDTVILIETKNYISSGIVGDAAITPKIWYTRQWLINNTTQDELLSLLKYPNSAVRATAFQGLYNIEYPDLFNVLIDIMDNSNDYVHYVTGCIGEDISLGEYCFRYVLKYNFPEEPLNQMDITRKIHFTENQKRVIIEKLKKLTGANSAYKSLAE